MEIRDDGKTNPIIVISDDEVHAWLRQKADEAGFADRSMQAVQINGNDTFMHCLPQITVMVSNICGSRTVRKP
jgi:hypothetical protein